MKNSKTFRFFISSTFNDFREERKVLQTKVFPIIKNYCIDKGYRFQPIDLRWGINDEAQLDQKTLELCLDEVKTCKSYPNPNFLVMLGDRYGWIPLPYIIEQKEFEEILKFSDDKEKSLLKEWYQLDKNQLPSSYILKQREGKFREIENWNIIENTILKILQNNSIKASLTSEQKRKYFTSATEAEIEEGITPYLQPTAHQKKILNNNLQLEKEDTEYIFGFIRNIEKSSKCSEKFITTDYEKAQKLKTKVKEVLLNENVLEINTTQINEKDLDQSYLESFENKIILFLKQKLENQIKKETKFTKLEIENQEQEYFAKQKRQNFIGQETILKTINDYIENSNQQPFVLYGKSGSGKSSIMAKAIENAKLNSNSKIIYRFVGATSNSYSSQAILISLFKELEINIENHLESKTNLSTENETFEEFSLRIKNSILTLKKDIVIFIDAVDQLINNDQFLWLPHILPKNIKIIISALNDVNYKTDSTYFKDLDKITPNIHLIEQFNKPTELILNLLKKENRTLQIHQLNYFTNQYNNSKTPFYIYVASQEIKHWKSDDLTMEQTPNINFKIQDLANSQKGIIEEFINNLSEFFHHDKEFVQKILAYIYASKDGLSENELLELINTDTNFVQKLAPDTWHKNLNNELPLVIWTRLYTQLKPFLSKKTQDNEELLYFFHREFVEVLKNNINQKIEHENIIETIEKQISNFQNDEFYSNRWGILFSKSFSLYIKSNYVPNQKIAFGHPFINHKWIVFFTKINKEYSNKLIQWNLSYWNYFLNKNSEHIDIAYLISKSIYLINNSIDLYAKSLRDLIIYYIKKEEQKDLYSKNISWIHPLITELYNLIDNPNIRLENQWYSLNTITHYYYLWNKFNPFQRFLYTDNRKEILYKKSMVAEKLFSKNSNEYLECLNDILFYENDKKIANEKTLLLTNSNEIDIIIKLKNIKKQIENKDSIQNKTQIDNLYATFFSILKSLNLEQSDDYLQILNNRIKYLKNERLRLIYRIEKENILSKNNSYEKQRLNNLKNITDGLIKNKNKMYQQYLDILYNFYISRKDIYYKEYIQFINHYFMYLKIDKISTIKNTLEQKKNLNEPMWKGHYIKFLNNLIDYNRNDKSITQSLKNEILKLKK